MTISPASGFSSPAMQRIVVVFPHPLGPSSVKIRPSGISKLTPSTAASRLFSVSNAFLSPSTLIIAGVRWSCPAGDDARSLREADTGTQAAGHGRQADQHREHDHAQRPHVVGPPPLPQPKTEGGQH